VFNWLIWLTRKRGEVRINLGRRINGEIMKHLALALKATAAGLLVAIPATILYNTLMDKADRLLTRWDILYKRD